MTIAEEVQQLIAKHRWWNETLGVWDYNMTAALLEMARLVREETVEACARIADGYAKAGELLDSQNGKQKTRTGKAIAAAIRRSLLSQPAQEAKK